MLISILALPFSGATTIIEELTIKHGYTLITISPNKPFDNSKIKSNHFLSANDFLTYSTKYWNESFITEDLKDEASLQEFNKRPFVRFLSISTATITRWKRCQQLLPNSKRELESFLQEDDSLLHIGTSQQTPLSKLLPYATLTLSNNSTLPSLLQSLNESLPILVQSLRPNWDTYFMLLASLASLRSNCMKRRVGAILVKDHRVISTGYNGTPRNVLNCNQGGCGRCNDHGNGFLEIIGKENGRGIGKGGAGMGEGLEECLCLHAEENALLEAGRERVEGSTLYCNTCPCLRCTVKIVQCGVKEVIYSLSYSMDDASRRVMTEAGVGLRQIEMPKFPTS